MNTLIRTIPTFTIGIRTDLAQLAPTGLCLTLTCTALVSFGRDYWGAPVSAHPFRRGMEDPIVVWLPSIGLTGMTFYTGERFPQWKRNLFVGGLREGGIPGTGQLQRIVFNERWEELRREPMLMELKQRIRDVRQGE